MVKRKMMIPQNLTKDEFFANKLKGVTTILGDVLGKDEFKDVPENVVVAGVPAKVVKYKVE